SATTQPWRTIRKLCRASIFASASFTNASSAEEGMPCASGRHRGRLAAEGASAAATGSHASRARATSLAIMRPLESPPAPVFGARSGASPLLDDGSRGAERAASLINDSNLRAVPLDPVVPLLDPRAVLEALEMDDDVEGDVVGGLHAEVAAVAEPALRPEEVVGRVGGHRRVLVHAGERVLQAHAPG